MYTRLYSLKMKRRCGSPWSLRTLFWSLVCAKTLLWGLVKYKMAVWHPHAFTFNCTVIAILCHLGKTRRVENLFNSQISSSRFLRAPIGFHGNICRMKPTQIKGCGKVIVFCFSTFNLTCTCLWFFFSWWKDSSQHLTSDLHRSLWLPGLRRR